MPVGTGAPAQSHLQARWLRAVSFGSFRFYFVLALAIFFLHSIDAVMVGLPVRESQSAELVNGFKQKQVELWSEMNKLLIAFATVSIGAIGGFIVNRDKNHPLKPPQLRRAAVSWFFCALSLYFGYLSYQQGTLLLKHGVFDAFTPRLWWPARGQFWCYLISIILFGDFIYSSIGDKETKE